MRVITFLILLSKRSVFPKTILLNHGTHPPTGIFETTTPTTHPLHPAKCYECCPFLPNTACCQDLPGSYVGLYTAGENKSLKVRGKSMYTCCFHFLLTFPHGFLWLDVLSCSQGHTGEFLLVLPAQPLFYSKGTPT